jgi:UDP-N-acetylglucosamine 2-epimerase (non-hydrolysing)
LPRLKVAIVVGTRPEAIKLAPVCFELQRHPGLTPVLVLTGQHLDLVNSALESFGLVADEQLAVMTANQSPNDVAARVLERLPAVLERVAPAAVLVQGDTTTVLATSVAAFHLGIPLGHVEAGLRTHDLASPFPEEANRQLADRLATWCFAPTEGAKRNLLAEGIDEGRIHVCGNTAVDSILWMAKRAPSTGHAGAILVTLHRRESFGAPLMEILEGLKAFLDAQPEARAVWPVHPNPHVLAAAASALGDHPRFKQLPPLGYAEFAAILRDCRFVLTDSGGYRKRHRRSASES